MGQIGDIFDTFTAHTLKRADNETLERIIVYLLISFRFTKANKNHMKEELEI